MTISAEIKKHQQALHQCRRCPQMMPPPIVGLPVASKIILVGQAPGEREEALGKPFAWTAGKTLYKWLATIGLEEEAVRRKVYIAAVCRCFPGKKSKGGDRVPDREEVERCRSWLQAEFDILQPALIIPVGKLAIAQFVDVDKLVDVVGTSFSREIDGHVADIIPLPHPSGASTWHGRSPGKELLQQALKRIKQHPQWYQLL
ncbi:MAG: uracil-DNA glycosylase family protein [Gammaproteobacteria bacterium]|nr:uracil-DNA glycosylase family protein [Gammaproteobacteria bacterium]